MADIAELGLYIDSSGVVRATKELKRLDKQSGKNEKSTKSLTKSFGGLGTALGALGLGAAMRSVLKSTIEQERAVAQLDAAVKSTGATAGFTSKELQAMAASLQGVTTFGDEAIISMQSVLLTFTNLKGDVLPQTTEAVLNLSARMGQDLQSSAVMLGKALNDPIANLGALGRAGIQFSDDQKEMIKTMAETGNMAGAQKIILRELETQFGGAARAARDTFGGALAGLSNAFGDLMEEDGDGMQDAKRATEELTAILKDPATKKAFSAITGMVISLTASIVKGVTALNEFGTALGKNLATGFAPDIDELDSKIASIEGTITKLAAKRDEHIANAPSFFDFMFDDASEINQTISNLEARLSDLRSQKAEMPIGVGGAVDAAISIDDQASAEAERLRLIADAKAAAQEEIWAEEFFRAQEHSEHLIDIEYDRKQRSLEILEEEANARKAVMSGMFNNLVSLMNSGSKKMFNIGKVSALANGILNLRESVMSAYAAGSEVGGPIVGAAYAATAGLAQAANLAKIKSASFGGGGGAATVSSTTGGQPVTGQIQMEPPSMQEQPVMREVRITVESDGVHSDGMRKFAEDLSETIKDMGGVTSLVVS